MLTMGRGVLKGKIEGERVEEGEGGGGRTDEKEER